MRTYNVYAKPIQNNIGGEREFVAQIYAQSKGDAVHKVRNDPSKSGLYRLESFKAEVIK